MNYLVLQGLRAARLHWFAYCLGFTLLLLTWQLIWGEHGLMDYHRLQENKVESLAALETVTLERTSLEGRVKHLRPDSLDLDLLEEQAKTILGFSHPDEMVIILK